MPCIGCWMARIIRDTIGHYVCVVVQWTHFFSCSSFIVFTPHFFCLYGWSFSWIKSLYCYAMMTAIATPSYDDAYQNAKCVLGFKRCMCPGLVFFFQFLLFVLTACLIHSLPVDALGPKCRYALYFFQVDVWMLTFYCRSPWLGQSVRHGVVAH